MWLLDDGSLVALFELLGATGDPAAILGWKTHLNRVYRDLADASLILSVYDCRTIARPRRQPSPGARRSAPPLRPTWTRPIGATSLPEALYVNRLFFAVQVRPPRYEGEFWPNNWKSGAKPTPIGDVPRRGGSIWRMCAPCWA
jgi:hypothetical protein